MDTSLKTTPLQQNLARRLRPRHFHEVIGQEMPVKMLQNSLFKNHFFPVYLFSGQKGCGKTSTARIFATAINCAQFETFQQDPRTLLPCGACDSCQKMIVQGHPDFIEIDAASHTGVDDMRELLDSCTFLPFLGKKRVYLIDEAHMLSKAAFNALLKVLEEPPHTALFMLATTELHKIPDTVRSRCFQLLFNAIDSTTLIEHLEKVCLSEEITFEKEALRIIVQETEGSARDALNALEQVRFSPEGVTVTAVHQTLGKVSNYDVSLLLESILHNNPNQLLARLEELQIKSKESSIVWGTFLQACRATLLLHYEVSSDFFTTVDPELTQRIKQHSSKTRLHAIMQLLWEQESVFLATPYKYNFLESTLLLLCEQISCNDLSTLVELLKTQKPSLTPPSSKIPTPENNHQKNTATEQQPVVSTPLSSTLPTPENTTNAETPPWKVFLKKIEEQKDPILLSILSQATLVSIEDDKITISLANHSPFFMDKLKDSDQLTRSALTSTFGIGVELVIVKGEKKSPQQTSKPSLSVPPSPARTLPQPSPLPLKRVNSPSLSSKKSAKAVNTFSFSPEEWPFLTLVLKHFPGTVKKLSSLEQ